MPRSRGACVSLLHLTAPKNGKGPPRTPATAQLIGSAPSVPPHLADPSRMRTEDLVRLVSLGALWGASFPFMRVAAPALGPVGTAAARVGIAGILISGWLVASRRRLPGREAWRHFAVIGFLNSSLPFSLFAFAAYSLPSSYSAILNATSPLFGMALAPIWLATRPSRTNVLGALLGFTGVSLIAGLGPLTLDGETIAAIVACLVAAACYALVGIYVKLKASHLEPTEVAGFAQLVSAALLVPFLFLPLPLPEATAPIDGGVILSITCLGVLCSALAYLLYFRLIADIGPTRALTVTFLIPVFGVTWGAIFLSEPLTTAVVVGCGVVIVGTKLAVRAPA